MKKAIYLTIRLILGGVFIYAGANKIITPVSFADSIASFELLPNSFINLFAIALPLFEIFVGLFIIIGWRLRAASLALVLLCAVFSVALSLALVRGLEVDCGCFGASTPSVGKTWFSLGRGVILLGLAFLLYRDTVSETLKIKSTT